MLEFWATTCGPCLPEIPHLKAMNDRFPESAFQIIGITQDDDTEKLKRFLGQREMTGIGVGPQYLTEKTTVRLSMTHSEWA